MSTPTLTPLETPIFDDDVIASMEEHADDEVSCDMPDCDAPAHVLALTRCCRSEDRLCERHYWAGRKAVEEMAALSSFLGCAIQCRLCGHVFPGGAVFDDLFRVVMPI